MINKAIILGNLGGDPETRYTQSGTAVTTFSVATTDKWKGADGQMQESTEWHKCVVWGKLAETCSKYLQKGSRVYAEGKIQTRKWQDKDGHDRYTTEIIVKEIKFLSYNDRQGEHTNSAPPHTGMGEDVPF